MGIVQILHQQCLFYGCGLIKSISIDRAGRNIKFSFCESLSYLLFIFGIFHCLQNRFPVRRCSFRLQFLSSLAEWQQCENRKMFGIFVRVYSGFSFIEFNSQSMFRILLALKYLSTRWNLWISLQMSSVEKSFDGR